MTGGMVPVLDAEPSYENIPQGLLSAAEPLWRDEDCRRYAYWSVFAGACGFTYGHNAIMQMADDSLRPGSYNCWESWKEAIHHPGGDSMAHLARLMQEVDFSRGHEASALLDCEHGRAVWTDCPVWKQKNICSAICTERVVSRCEKAAWREPWKSIG